MNPRSRTFTQADEDLLNGYQDQMNGIDREILSPVGFQAWHPGREKADSCYYGEE